MVVVRRGMSRGMVGGIAFGEDNSTEYSALCTQTQMTLETLDEGTLIQCFLVVSESASDARTTRYAGEYADSNAAE